MPNPLQSNLFQPNLHQIVNPKHELVLLAEKIDWKQFDEAFDPLYSHTGQPAKPIRLMISLLMLKHLYNLGDETIMDAWVQNPYFQYFSGMDSFQWKAPCDLSDLVYFRKRIGDEGIEKIFKHSVQLHGDEARETNGSKQKDTNKIYSFHAPHTYCMAKGKEHKPYEFGTKASIALGFTTGVILSAFCLKENDYDGHTLPMVVELNN